MINTEKLVSTTTCRILTRCTQGRLRTVTSDALSRSLTLSLSLLDGRIAVIPLTLMDLLTRTILGIGTPACVRFAAVSRSLWVRGVSRTVADTCAFPTAALLVSAVESSVMPIDAEPLAHSPHGSCRY